MEIPLRPALRTPLAERQDSGMVTTGNSPQTYRRSWMTSAATNNGAKNNANKRNC